MLETGLWICKFFLSYSICQLVVLWLIREVRKAPLDSTVYLRSMLCVCTPPPPLLPPPLSFFSFFENCGRIKLTLWRFLNASPLWSEQFEYQNATMCYWFCRYRLNINCHTQSMAGEVWTQKCQHQFLNFGTLVHSIGLVHWHGSFASIRSVHSAL